MKKVMLVLVALLMVSTFAFALESGPSNKVGYVKIATAGGATPTFTQFGLPFKFWNVPSGNVPQYGTESRKPSSICGTQPNCGAIGTADRIMRQDNQQFAWRRTDIGCAWTGSLETAGVAQMEPGRAYWYKNASGAARNLVLAGEADTTAAGIPTVAVSAGAFTSYSWRDPRDVARNNMNLLAQGFLGGGATTSDKVVAQRPNGGFFWYNTSTNVWSGTLLGATPGDSYWIQNKHTGSWNYTYLANGQQLTMPGGGSELQKISAPAVVPTEKSRTATK